MNTTDANETSPHTLPDKGGTPRVRLPRVAAVAVILIVLILTAVFAGLAPRRRERAAVAAETSALATPAVTVVALAPGKAAGGLLLPAEVRPWVEAPIHARATGYLKRRLVDLGARVEAGQLLAEIEAPELDQELESARHQLSQAEAAAALAKTTSGRYAMLVKSDYVTRQENDEKQADFSVKTAAVSAARANFRRLEELRSFTRVTAPFTGTITARETDVGELIASGGKELFRLAQTDKLRVFVSVPQAQAPRITPGQTAELLIPEQPNRAYTAIVARTGGAISSDSRTLLTELEVDNARGEVLAGSFAQVRFADSKGAEPLTLPGNTLLFRAEGPQVAVVRPDDTVELRSVKLGHDFGQTVQIVAGVGPDDRVILNPSDSLVDGTTVRVVALAEPQKPPMTANKRRNAG